MKIQYLLPAATLLLAPSASAQFTFSFDFHGPSRSAADCGGMPMTEGDILAPCPAGTPVMPKVPGPLPSPRIFIPAAGPGSLGLPPVCVGAPPGVLCGPGMEVDALSYGADTPINQNIFTPGSNFLRKANYNFSVDEWALGVAGAISPTVADEAGVGDAGADVFVDLGFLMPPPFTPFGGGMPGNNADVDGDGRPQFPTYWAYPGTGLIEPSAPGVPPDLGDNLDALNVDGGGATGLAFPVFYSLDSGIVDPRNGFPGSGSAIGMGFSGGDVLITPAPGGAPMLYAPAPVLGLDLIGGVDSDDLDALILWENGNPGYQPSFQPYDWITTPNNVDMLFFSVRTGSAVIGMPDSRFGIPIEAGDILGPPVPTFMGGVSPFPSLWVPAEDLGLAVSAARGGPLLFGDDLDALDYTQQKTLLNHEYCFGDGGLAGCNNCPCGNNMPAGTQSGCKNSFNTGARLEVSGFACVTSDTLRFELTGATPGSFAVLLAGTSRLPLAGFCPPGSGVNSIAFDGLRCIGGNVVRAGGRPTDANGDVGITNNGWGTPSGPAIGLLAKTGFIIPCTTIQWQAIYRDIPTTVCTKGLNTSQGVQTVVLP